MQENIQQYIFWNYPFTFSTDSFYFRNDNCFWHWQWDNIQFKLNNAQLVFILMFSSSVVALSQFSQKEEINLCGEFSYPWLLFTLCTVLMPSDFGSMTYPGASLWRVVSFTWIYGHGVTISVSCLLTVSPGFAWPSASSSFSNNTVMNWERDVCCPKVLEWPKRCFLLNKV